MNELKCEQENKLDGLPEPSENLIETIKQTQKTGKARLKALFEGFRQFCNETGFRADDIIKTAAIDDACFNVYSILVSDVDMDKEYANVIKQFFVDHWNF